MLAEVLDAADARGWVENSVTTLVTLSGRRVALVPGEAGNTKVTVEQDWDEAARRISG
jgi:2-C-methyl-D-erythritol 4-phosphate cytidylyltransferase